MAKREIDFFQRGLRATLNVVATAFIMLFVTAAADEAAWAPRTQLNKPWPAVVATLDDIPAPQLPLKPADAVKTLTMPPGYQLEVAASEPMVQDPIIAEFDGDGRLWVLEMHGFAHEENMDNSFAPINDVVVLEDTNDDGAFDKRTVFMDGLVMPRALKVLDRNCALVGAPPKLILACDRDGDLKADTQELIADTFDKEGVVEHGANALLWGLDNTIYVSQHVWNVKLGPKGFRIVPSVLRGQWGLTQDDYGRTYRNINTEPLFVDYVAPSYFARNPNLTRTSGLYENLVDQNLTQIWPSRPNPGLNRGYRVDTLRADGSASYYGGVSSPFIYRGDRLPRELAGMALVVDGPTNIVHLLNLRDDGTGRLYADDFYKRGEFIASTDERFRPVQVVPGWDGSMYVIDMYRGVSQDGPLQTDYLRTYINQRKLWEHINLGRIYRVLHTDFKPDRKPSMSDDTTSELVQHLSHPSGWWRDKAQQYLVQRADPAAIQKLRTLLRRSKNEVTKLHALWTLSGLDDMGLNALDFSTVKFALTDSSWALRAAGLRLSERWVREGDKKVVAAVLALQDDPHWQVRRQLAATLGELPVDRRIDALINLLSRYGREDSVVVDVAVSGLKGMEEAALDKWLAQGRPDAGIAGALAGAAAKPKNLAAIERLFARAADRRYADDVRKEMLDGLARGLEGADGRQGGGVVAGGRAGTRPPGMRADAAPSVKLELTGKPDALLAVANGEGPVADSARYASALLGWPGKPKAVARKRTADEETAYVAGKTIFTDVCSGCHGAQGIGTPAGKPLAGSKLVVGDPSVVSRILLHGKEGSLGLMPPPSLDDESLAAVITYIRGSFGNVADPVNRIAVREYRQAYTYRNTPWTEEELARRVR